MRMLKCGCALVAIVAASPVLAQTAPTPPTNETLADLVRRQAAEIADLRARVEQLEGHGAASTSDEAPDSVIVVSAEEKDSGLGANARVVTLPYAPQLITPTPVERDIVRAQAAKDAGVTTEWGAGLPVFHSADGQFSFKPRGRILSDVGTTFGSDHDARNITTTGMRSLRLGFEGGVGTHLFYQLEAELGQSKVQIMAASLGWRDNISAKTSFDVQAGNLFNDRSFDGSTGSDSTPFMERSVVADAIAPERGYFGMGAMGRLYFPAGHLAVTVTGDTVDADHTQSDSRTAMARLHLNPLHSDRGLLHVAAWGFDEALNGSSRTLTPSTFVDTRFNGALRVQSGALTGATGTTGYGFELGGYQGPVWFMAEGGERRARLDDGRPDFRTRAYSLSAGWFVTGELPPYNPRVGSFGRPHVLSPVFDGGPGAIELTTRYEQVSFRNLPDPADGWSETLGANWYLNSFTRIQLNAVYWSVTDALPAYAGTDKGETLAARFGVTF
ncbi:OprO/OprP family phosphate-selective porin [Novosphingobium sp. MBES04]|uniref:OprO/OprP family phosphate-selective porin n=1 Tax=Novosphingobium sp. MBES04 TaxID=1206458 RepID=UPI00057D67EE|nr:porin [Novosphingobium sp. MBES04]